MDFQNLFENLLTLVQDHVIFLFYFCAPQWVLKGDWGLAMGGP